MTGTVRASSPEPERFDPLSPDRVQIELGRVADRLERMHDSLVDAQVRATRRFDSYAGVPEPELRASCRRNVLRAVSVLRGVPDLPEHAGEDERQSGLQRVMQGVPTDDVVEAYRLGLAELRDAFLSEATDERVGVDAVKDGVRRLWQLVDHFSSTLVSARHEAELELARRDERDRIAFVTAAITDRLTMTEQTRAGAEYGMTPELRYWLSRWRGGFDDLMRQEWVVARQQSLFRPVTAPFADDLVVISSCAPPDAGRSNGGLTAGVAGPLRLDQLAAGFAEATELLEAAVLLGADGPQSLSDLSIRLAVVRQADIGRLLAASYVEPVLAGGPRGIVFLETVREYLAQRRSIPATARAISVHVNTVRYRLERFAELTQCSLDESSTLTEIWWALEHHALESRRALAPPASAESVQPHRAQCERAHLL